MKTAGWVVGVLGGVFALIGIIWYNSIPYYGPQNIPPIIFLVIGIALLIIGGVLIRKAHARPDAALADARAALTSAMAPNPTVVAPVVAPIPAEPSTVAHVDVDVDVDRAGDLATEPAVLAEIVGRRPDLWVVVASNPATYRELAEWLQATGDQDVIEAVARSAEGRARWAAAGDASTPAEELGRLAYSHPELRERIASNPSAYEELRAWIAEAGLTPPSDTL